MSASDRGESSSSISQSEAVIRTLYQITSNYQSGFANQMRRLLKLGCERFNLEIGILSRVVDQDYEIVHTVAPAHLGLVDGARFALGETYCSITLNASGPTGFEAMGRSKFHTHPAYQAFGLESYLGTPIVVDGELFGTLNFSSPERREREFTEIDIDSIQLMASWAASELSHQRALQAQRMANDDLKMFTNALSHDLRQPLQTIRTCADLLNAECADALDAQALTDLANIDSASERMGHILDGLMRLFQVNSSSLHRARVNLSDIVRSLGRELQRGAPDRQVVWSIADEISAEGDEGLLRTVLQNLVGNAWKFTATRSPSQIDFGVSETDGRRTYYVKDNGIGFDMAQSSQLFAPFQRLHRRQEFAGTGLGLATVKRIISAHGGEIWAHSEPGLGACFHFTIGW